MIRRLRLGWMLSTPALAVLVTAAVAGAAVGVGFIRHEIEVRATRGAQLSAALVETLVVARNINSQTIRRGRVGPTARADMTADVAGLRAVGKILGLTVWAANRRLLYANPDDATVQRILPADELARVLDGGFIEADGGRSTMALDVVVPYDSDGDGGMDAVVEVALPRDPVNDTIAQATRLLYSGIAVALLLAAIGLWRGRRRRRARDHTARHDGLSGLGNRLLLTERCQSALTHPHADRPIALLLMDIDDFRQVNDTLGHEAGDDLLAAVSQRLRAAVPPGGTVYRLGGDEFVILLTELPAGSDQASEVANHLLQTLNAPVVLAGLGIEVAATAGIALAPQHGTDTATLLRHAEAAMYAARGDGTTVAVYEPTSDDGRERLTLLAELRVAIAEGQLRLHYQPKTDIDGRVTGVEALIRWQHPRRGLLGPGHFVPLAESTALIHAITGWVLGEAARQAAAWRAAGCELTIAVNACPRDLHHADLPAMLLQAAQAVELPPSALQIEITETAVMVDPHRIAMIVGQLRQLGVAVWIDDFGAGYTSLAYLPTLAVSGLKIDRQFVGNLHNPAAETVVRSIVHLAHDLGLISVAEGVETTEQLARLASLGCQQIQGYLRSPPLPPDRLIEWVAGRQPATTAAASS